MIRELTYASEAQECLELIRQLKAGVKPQEELIRVRIFPWRLFLSDRVRLTG